MALERVGLGGVMTFDGQQAVKAIGQTRDSLGQFVKGENRAVTATQRLGQQMTRMTGAFRKAGASMGRALGQMGGALRGAGLAGLPLTAVLGLGIKKAADFEQQMSAVGAITGGTAEDMKRLELKAKEMGATTVFSATQSAQAMESMGRAGFSTQQIIDGLGGVMDLAAADGLDLATAASITSNVIKSMGLEAKDTTRVADVLALTSAKTNTDVTGLGEAFKFSAAQAKNLGIPLEETAAALGAVADAGLKGSLGGTSFTNMLIKLTKPSGKATKLMKEWGVELQKNDDGTLNLTKTMKVFNTALGGITDRVERSAAATEIFGVRGQKAFAAIGASIDSGKFDVLKEQIEAADGAAKEMAEKRLNNLAGQLTLMASAMEGFALETAGAFLGPMTDGVKGFTKNLSAVVGVLQLLQDPMFDNEAAVEKYGQTAVSVAKGIADAVKLVIDVFTTVRTTVTDIVKQFGGDLGPGAIQSIVKIVAVVGLLVAAFAPVALAIGGLAFFISSVLIPGFAAVGAIIGVIFSGPIIAAVAAVVAAVGIMVFIFTQLRDEISSAFNVFLELAAPAVDFIRDKVVEFVTHAIAEVKDFASGFTEAIRFLKPVFKVVFEAIGAIAGRVFQGIALVIGGLVAVAKPVLSVFKNIAKFLIEDIVNSIVGVVSAIVKLADAVNFDVPTGLREFAQRGTFRVTSGGSAASIATDATESRKELADSATEQAAAQKAAGAEGVKLEATIDLTDKRTLDIQNNLCVDSREMAVASSRHKQEVNERAGFKATPWQRRVTLEQGAAPVGGTGGG